MFTLLYHTVKIAIEWQLYFYQMLKGKVISVCYFSDTFYNFNFQKLYLEKCEVDI